MFCKTIPYEGAEPYIFVSYSHFDEEEVYPLLEELSKKKYRVWYDEGIHPGDDWPEVIAAHLQNSSLIIAILSQNASSSHNCRKELTFALQEKKRVIPVMIHPVILSLGQKMQLSECQILVKKSEEDFSELAEHLSKVQEMSACLGQDIMIRDKSEVKLSDNGKYELQNNAEMIDDKDELSVVIRPNRKKEEELSTFDNKQVSASTVETLREEKAEPDPVSEESDHLLSVEEEKETTIPHSMNSYSEKDKQTELNALLKLSEPQKKFQKEIDEGEETVRVIENTEIELDGEETVLISKDIEEDWSDKTVRINRRDEWKAVFMVLKTVRLFSLQKEHTLLGRTKGEIKIENPKISSLHAAIHCGKEGMQIEDLNSTNGTSVNYSVVEEGTKSPLSGCDVIIFGDDEICISAFGEEAKKILKEKTFSYLVLEETGEIHPLTREPLRIGRSYIWPGNSLSDKRVSRFHGTYIPTDSGYSFERSDKETTNDTLFNGNRLSPSTIVEVHDGDVLSVGDIQHILFKTINFDFEETIK